MKQQEFMRLALYEAQKAQRRMEVPVGAIIVQDGNVIARAYNRREIKKSVTAHAELLAIQKACKKLKSWRLSGCDLYVTLEPCPMCAGAIIQARIKHVYFGAYDKKAGAVESVVRLFDVDTFNHHVEYTGGILEKECSAQLSNFFKILRKKNK